MLLATGSFGGGGGTVRECRVKGKFGLWNLLPSNDSEEVPADSSLCLLIHIMQVWPNVARFQVPNRTNERYLASDLFLNISSST